MRLTPSPAAVDIAVAGACMLLAGVLLFQPVVVAWGGAVLVALGAARAATWVSIARVRQAGFAMSWKEPQRTHTAVRGETLQLHAHIANGDSRAVLFEALTVASASGLRLVPEDTFGEVPAEGGLEVAVAAEALRVGEHGVFGLSLRLRGTLGLFSITLSFSNPIGVSVEPRTVPLRNRLVQPSRRPTGSSPRASSRGDEGEFAELREHVPGDPFKHIDWKSTARRGALHVRRYELPVLDDCWCLIDMSSELWAGGVGKAPLDSAIDYAYSLAKRLLRTGHRVGFVVLRGGRVERVPARAGTAQRAALRELLIAEAAPWDPDSCGLDERGAAYWVREHVSSLLPAQAASLRVADTKTLVRAALSVRNRAPFLRGAARAFEQTGSPLFAHLAAFGISVPGKLQPQAPATQAALAAELRALMTVRPAETQVHVVAPMPLVRASGELLSAVTVGRRRLGALTWTFPEEEIEWSGIRGVYKEPARTVFRLASRVRRHQGELTLRHLGVNPRAIRGSTQSSPSDAARA